MELRFIYLWKENLNIIMISVFLQNNLLQLQVYYNYNQIPIGFFLKLDNAETHLEDHQRIFEV